MQRLAKRLKLKLKEEKEKKDFGRKAGSSGMHGPHGHGGVGDGRRGRRSRVGDRPFGGKHGCLGNLDLYGDKDDLESMPQDVSVGVDVGEDGQGCRDGGGIFQEEMIGMTGMRDDMGWESVHKSGGISLLQSVELARKEDIEAGLGSE